MRGNWLKRLGWTLVVVVIVALAGWFAWPQPIAADLAAVKKGPMEVTADDEGKTRVRDVYTVSAPLAGRVLRTPRRVGDEVLIDDTIVAVMQPSTPSFHDARTHDELQAALVAAEAAVTLAEAEIRRMDAALQFSRTDLQRAETLIRTDAISPKALDKAKFDVQTNEAALASAKAQLEVRRNERASVAARARYPSGPAALEVNPSCCVQIRAPVTGRVLKIAQESEAVVPAGAPLMEIGDPANLEVIADLLSTEAVRIKPGAAVRIDGWGGAVINARVARVEPAGFTKVSALGIDEQRVRTVIDFVDPRETWVQLGHDYRVIVHIVIWKGDNVLSVPVGALFRKGDDWAVFSIKNGRAATTVVKVGHRNSRVAEIVSGLSEGDQVVLHPSDRIGEGVLVAQRETR